MGARPRFRNVIAHVCALRPDIDDPAAAIRERRLLVGGVIILDPATQVRSDAGIVLRPRPRLRGSAKLEAALDRFGCPVLDAVCLDVGASAGGFTSVLLGRGARLVYAVDAGFGQLRGQLRADPRVVNLERTNLSQAWKSMPDDTHIEVMTVDLSYVSLSVALPQLDGVGFAPDADMIALIKPMFELGLERPPRDRTSLRRARSFAIVAARAAGWRDVTCIPSPVPGSRGAREYLLHAKRS
jgi:23S rRNA (cytidine1920-2'-O)/16S rRNA (cytidine1409-2'-O)-methyltransferase